MSKVEFRGSVPGAAWREKELNTILDENTLSQPEWNSNLDVPVMGSLVYCESSALDHAATEVGRVENYFGTTPLSIPDQESNLDLPVIDSLVYCESSVLDYAATEISLHLQFRSLHFLLCSTLDFTPPSVSFAPPSTLLHLRFHSIFCFVLTTFFYSSAPPSVSHCLVLTRAVSQQSTSQGSTGGGPPQSLEPTTPSPAETPPPQPATPTTVTLPAPSAPVTQPGPSSTSHQVAQSGGGVASDHLVQRSMSVPAPSHHPAPRLHLSSLGQGDHPQQQPRPPAPTTNRPTLGRSVSRSEVVKQYIKRETAVFFGVEESCEKEQQERWLNRRKRLATRKYGPLREGVAPPRTPTTPSPAPPLTPHITTSAYATQQSRESRPDVLPSAQGRDSTEAPSTPRWSEPPVRRKESVAKMTFGGLAFVVADLNPNLPVIGGPVYCKSDAIDHSTTETGSKPLLVPSLQHGDVLKVAYPRYLTAFARKINLGYCLVQWLPTWGSRHVSDALTMLVETLTRHRPRPAPRSRQWLRSYAPSTLPHTPSLLSVAADESASPTFGDDEVFFDKPIQPAALTMPLQQQPPGDSAGPSTEPAGGEGGFTVSRDQLDHPLQLRDQYTTRERPPSWRRTPERMETASESGPEVGCSRIWSRVLDRVFDNSDRRTYGMGVMGRFFGRSIKRRVAAREDIQEQLEDIEDHRPFFTYWVTTVQVLILIISLVCYGLGPIGIDLNPRSGQVLVTSLSLQQVDYKEPANFWIGPRAADLIHLGAKFAPCMRKDAKIIKEIEKGREKERETACCIRNDDSGCVQSSQADCSVSWSNFVCLRPLYPKTISTWKKWSAGDSGPGGRISGSVCGLDPKFCEAPASVAPYEWPDDITKWPICRKTNSNPQMRSRYKDKIADHMVCEVSCLDDVCGMIAFFSPETPDQFYRLWMSLFLHAGIFQLAITLVIQYFLMRDLEKLTGSLRIMIIYMGSGVAGNLASAIFVPYRADVSITFL
uniref:Peptidase S54 rhomboid domain-containing protein n=1 Tax=Timema genevievae TaxID=629358 RepID=A0A7R9PJ38_TIMGE|nr:unnamed protein product [Timema genevievae]